LAKLASPVKRTTHRGPFWGSRHGIFHSKDCETFSSRSPDGELHRKGWKPFYTFKEAAEAGFRACKLHGCVYLD